MSGRELDDPGDILHYMSEAAKASRPWSDPFRSYSKYIGDTSQLLDLTYEGFHRVISNYEILEILQQGEEVDEQEAAKLAYADQRAQLARQEIDNDFPLLHAHALLGLWSALEACVEDVTVAWISHKAELLNEPAISRIKIPFAEYEQLTLVERRMFLVRELQRDLRADLKLGAAQFEGLLTAVRLGGKLDDRVRRSLFQTQQIRNVLAHRAGIADRRLVERCPDLGLSIGSTVKIDRELFQSCALGMQIYAVIIRNRCTVLDGGMPAHVDVPGFEGATKASVLSDDGTETGDVTAPS